LTEETRQPLPTGGFGVQAPIASRSQILVMAMVAGITVANLYYSQPILAEIAQSFGVGQAEVGYVPVLTQIGYGLGLFLLTPLGDMIDRKRLVIGLELVLAFCLVGISLVNSIGALYAGSLLLGILSVSVQVVIPMAATLAPKEKRGAAVGTVFTGVLTGVLLARVLSGVIAQWLGWRWVYGISAGLILGMAGLVFAMLPNAPAHHVGSYLSLLRSTVKQVQRFPVLRRVALMGGLIFGAFSSFWTTLTFHLSSAPFGYRSDVIGSFGFPAVAGTLVTPVFSRFIDRGNPARSQIFTICIMILGVLTMALWPSAIAAMVVATLLLDIGMQATQVGNLAQIYGLDATAHSRINTVFMTSFFVGGAIGSYAGVLCWGWGGWTLVCWQVLLWILLAIGVAVVNYRLAGRISPG
jgi:predicted MFS family arabinose efflux permease